MTLEEIIADITSAGFLVNNLFQCNTKQWQANLRNAHGATNFHIADTPAEALEGCMLKLNDLVPFIENTGTYTTDGPRPSLYDLIRRESSTPINRRF
jgi:hypothetical protein